MPRSGNGYHHKKKTMHSTRLHALDNLRTFVVFLVIVLHGSMTYMAYAPKWWYVVDVDRSLLFTILVMLIDVPIMLIMFFLAGYFTVPSLEKRGAGRFLEDKLARIGIPWMFGVLVLAPPTAYMIYFSRNVPMSLLTFWQTDFWGKAFQQSVYWYLGILLTLFALTALVYARSHRFSSWKQETGRPDWRVFVYFVLGVSAGSLLIGLAFNQSLDAWFHVYILSFQPARLPLYIGYFALGIFAYQRGWFTDQGYVPGWGRWLSLCLASGAVYINYRFSVPPGQQTLASTVIVFLLFNVFCFSSLMGSVAFFQAHVAFRSSFWRSQARNSYGIYYLHPLILYPLALMFVSFSASIYLKAALLILLAYVASWGMSAAILTRAPVLRRVF